MRPLIFAEFFAGGGMARAGLGECWRCVFANDINPAKSASYIANWGGEHLKICDVADLTADDIPERVSLCWASPPCTHVSLAGRGSWRDGLTPGLRRLDGLGPEAWASFTLAKALHNEGRAPRLIVLENLPDLITVNVGEDFDRICDTLTGMGYRYGCVVIDAALFTPQSRERLFVIAADRTLSLPAHILSAGPSAPFHPSGLRAALHRQKDAPLWFNLPMPPPRTAVLADILEDDANVRFNTPAETLRIVRKMTQPNTAKLDELRQKSELHGRRDARALCRRTRTMKDGRKVTPWELRDDDVVGCLRTAGGGPSTQSIVVVDRAGLLFSRRLTPRECARLMGLSDSYALPVNVIEGYDLVGDGVVVPVVRFLASHVLEPILAANVLALDGAPQ